MTFDDDFCRIYFESGHRDIGCKANNIEWPPPNVIKIGGFIFKRGSFSQITDKQREEMTHVMRGAEYYPIIGDNNETNET